MSELVTQPTATPTRKVTAATLASALATLVVWGMNLAGLDVPAEPAMAIGTVFVGLSGWFVKDRA